MKRHALVLLVCMLAVCAGMAEARGTRMVIAAPSHQWGIDTRLVRELRDAGHEVLVYPDAPSVSERFRAQDKLTKWENLSLYNILVFGGSGNLAYAKIDPKTGLPPQWVTDFIPQLKRFLNEGGGVFFVCRPGWDWAKSVHVMTYILQKLDMDAELFPEDVMDHANMVRCDLPQGTRWGRFCWTDQIAKDPLTQGVGGLWYPVADMPDGTTVFNPIRVGPAWRVLVKGMPTAASYAKDHSDTTGTRHLKTPGVYKSSPPMIAVREYGKGRVVLWPMDTNFGILDGWNPAVGGTTMDGNIGGRRSGGAQLIKNLLVWLAEPGRGSKTIGRYDPKTYKVVPPEPELGFFPEEVWTKDVRPGSQDFAHQYKALIGAHSNLSDGANSPDEMIAAAKAHGYQVVAFTENLPDMTEAKWKKLVAVCDKASGGDFAAYPGLDFMDEAGNHGVIFGQHWWVKKEWYSKKHPGRIVWLNNFTYMADPDAHHWAPNCIINARTNNKRAWEQALWRHFSPFCYEGGNLVDESLHEWFLTIGRYGFNMNTGMFSVHTVRSVQDVAATAQPGLMQTYVRANRAGDILDALDGTYGPDPGDYFPSYISSGPEIVQYRMINFGTCDLTIPGNDRSVLHIRARSPVGLKEVLVLRDVREPWYRFLPKGKKDFEVLLNVFKDAQHQYVLRVTDMKGGVAYSWQVYTETQPVHRKRCGDNWNYVRYGQGGGRSAEGYRGHDGEGAPRLSIKRYAGELAWVGHGGLSCTANRRFTPANFLVEGKPAENWVPLMSLNHRMVGRYGEILTNEFPRDYRVKRPDPWTTGSFGGPYAAVATPWPTEITCHIPMKKYDGLQVALVEGKLTFAKQVTTTNGKPIHVGIGACGGGGIGPHQPGEAILEVMQPNAVSRQYRLADLRPKESRDDEIPVGGYIAWYGPDAPGVGAVMALEPGIRYNWRRGWLSIYKEVPVPVEPGTEVTWRCLVMNGSGLISNTNAEIEAVRVGMGLCGLPAFYDVLPLVGAVESQEFFLKLRSKGHAFSGRIFKKSRLPIHLPVMVSGLNRRWDAGIWYRGKAVLEEVRYYFDNFGELHPGKTERVVVEKQDRIEHIPVMKGGVGYCYVQTDHFDPDVFIGNFLVCNRPQVFLTLVKAEPGKCTFEINNPTDRTLKCTVRPAKGFTLAGRFKKRISLPAGGFEVVTVKSRW